MNSMENLISLKEFTDSKEVCPLFEEVQKEDGTKRKDLFIQGPFLEGLAPDPSAHRW